MARFDALGMFWEDLAPVKPPKKEKPKSVPPEPIWLLPSYLPGLAEAQVMAPDILSDQGIYEAWQAGERFSFDIESYPNWWAIAFKSVTTNKVIYMELLGGDAMFTDTECEKLYWIMTNITTIGFYSKGFDLPQAAIACAGGTCHQLFMATQYLIVGTPKEVVSYKKGIRVTETKLVPMKPHDVLRKYKVKKLECDSIDLIELVKLRPSLKICSGRLHAKRMQDLPFPPGTILSTDQITISRWYHINDLDNTILLYKGVLPQVELREQISKKYGIDVRSRSDAQIAEDVLSTRIMARTGQKHLTINKVEPGTVYEYNVPKFLKFESALMNYVLGQVKLSRFIVAPSGKVFMPKQLKALKIEINSSVYQMGIGGLHSMEKKRATVDDGVYFVKDRDVTSYYPRIILNQGLKPANLGQNFTLEYTTIVDDRVRAKEAGDTVTADTYKIVANGSFGKFGSKYSILYSPQLLIQTTITGQLAILMLIERLEMADFEVVSANTDGIVTRGLHTRVSEFNAICAQWERDTGFTTEETCYKGLYCRDINNYVAIYTEPQKKKLYKGKGFFGEVPLDKNPTTRICYLAAVDHILHGTNYENHIRLCRDITQFLTIRRVTKGAYKDGIYLGKAIRWYYAAGQEGTIINAINGNQIPRSEGAKPCMTLPDVFPDDIDYEWYIQETEKILKQIGYTGGEDLDEDDEEDEDEDETSDDEITIED